MCLSQTDPTSGDPWIAPQIKSDVVQSTPCGFPRFNRGFDTQLNTQATRGISVSECVHTWIIMIYVFGRQENDRLKSI